MGPRLACFAQRPTAAILAGWFAASICTQAYADNRVLVIGIDGAGGRFLRDADTPHIDALIARGGVRYDYQNEGALRPNPPAGYGASGVNWSTITTGASATHHGVTDNNFGGSRFDEYPFFFKYLKQADPGKFTASIVNWAPINERILDPADSDLVLSGLNDAAVRSAAINLLATGDPDAIFLHFDQVDAAGHSSGWGSPAFNAAIRTVDALIGDVMAAVNARPQVVAGEEDWLVLVTADHGGQGTGHTASQGPVNWEVPFVISGPSVPDGVELPQGTLRDVATTALWHLGVDPLTTHVDGKVRGIPYGPPNGVSGDLNQDGAIDLVDYAAFLAGYGQSLTNQPPAARHALGDLDDDGQHTLRDFLKFRTQFNKQRGPGAFAAALTNAQHAPEPSAKHAALLAATVVLVVNPARSPRCEP